MAIKVVYILLKPFWNFLRWSEIAILFRGNKCPIHKTMVSCQKGPTRHAYTWQIGPLWQDNLENYNQMPLFVQTFYCHVSQHKVQMTKMFYVDGY